MQYIHFGDFVEIYLIEGDYADQFAWAVYPQEGERREFAE